MEPAQDGTQVTITTQEFTGTFTGTTAGLVQVGTTSVTYYDVSVEGISDGMARVRITNSDVTALTTIQYWDGKQWKDASDESTSGNTIIGTIPVSALKGTIVAIGTPSQSWIYQGRPIDVRVSITNFGSSTETETLSLSYTGTAGAGSIASDAVILAPNETEMMTFTWNTTGVPICYDGYVITTSADISPQTDSNLLNNFLQSPFALQIRIMGDLNDDRETDGRDITMAARSFATYGPDYTYPGSAPSPGWNSACDINCDNRVDGKDLTSIATNFGRHSP
jgi:hypothetical protein